jgi:hypothetical protein
MGTFSLTFANLHIGTNEVGITKYYMHAVNLEMLTNKIIQIINKLQESRCLQDPPSVGFNFLLSFVNVFTFKNLNEINRLLPHYGVLVQSLIDMGHHRSKCAFGIICAFVDPIT